MRQQVSLTILALLTCFGCTPHHCPRAHPPAHAGAATQTHGSGHHESGHHESGHPGAGNHGSGHHAKPLVHRFEDAESYARKHEGAARDERQKPEQVIAAMQIAAGMTVVDIGTGSGYFLPHLSRAVGAGGKVLALDIEPVMIRFVTRRIQREQLSNVEPRLVMVDEPLLPSAAADRILIVNTYHHIPERRVYAAKLARALKPEGALWIVDYKLESKNGPPVKHRIAPSKVAEELAAAGFAARIETKLLAEQYLVEATLPQPR